MGSTEKPKAAKAPEPKREATHFVTEESHHAALVAMLRPVERPRGIDLVEIIRRASVDELHQFD